jgi:hypothetical protein
MGQPEHAGLQAWLAEAKETILTNPRGILPLSSRIRLWQLFDLAFPTEWNFRRCALSFMVAWDTTPEWYALAPYTQMTDAERAYPRDVLQVVRRVLLGQLNLHEAAHVLDLIGQNPHYMALDLPEGGELATHWAAYLAAIETLKSEDDEREVRIMWSHILSGRDSEDDLELEDSDVHFFAAFQFAQPNITTSPNELAEKYRIFWFNWLNQKVKLVLSESTVSLRERIRNAS